MNRITVTVSESDIREFHQSEDPLRGNYLVQAIKQSVDSALGGDWQIMWPIQGDPPCLSSYDDVYLWESHDHVGLRRYFGLINPEGMIEEYWDQPLSFEIVLSPY